MSATIATKGTATTGTLEKTLVVVNPASSGGRDDTDRVATWVKGQPHCTLKVTSYPGDAMRFVQQALAANTRRFVIAGGDGTIHEVIRLIARRDPESCTLGILPLGTGNDLARTLNIPLDFDEATHVIRDDHRQRMDLIRMMVGDAEPEFVINAATGGVSERVTGAVTPAYKSAFGPLAYVAAAVGMFRKVPKYRVQLDVDGQLFAVETPTMVIANGRTAGGGHPVAPNARVDDGMAETVVATPRTRGQQLKLLLRLEVAKHLDSDYVVHRRGRRIVVESDPPMPFSLDGERCEPVGRAVFDVLPKCLNVIVPSEPADDEARAGNTAGACPTCGRAWE